MRNTLRKGFTLVELLVVIAILAVLTAILLPVMANAKKKAKESVSLAQLKQLTAAQMMYAADNDGLFAVVVPPSTRWPVLLQPYFPSVGNTHPPYNVVQEYGGSTGYAVNACLRSSRGSYPDDTKAVLWAERAAYRRYPGEAVMYVSFNEAALPDRLEYERVKVDMPGLINVSPFGSNYYFGRGAYAFIDGHVALAREDEFLAPPRALCDVDLDTERLSSGRYRFAKAIHASEEQ